MHLQLPFWQLPALVQYEEQLDDDIWLDFIDITGAIFGVYAAKYACPEIFPGIFIIKSFKFKIHPSLS